MVELDLQAAQASRAAAAGFSAGIEADVRGGGRTRAGAQRKDGSAGILLRHGDAGRERTAQMPDVRWRGMDPSGRPLAAPGA